MTYIPKHRAETESDRAMKNFMDLMDRASERNKIKYKPFEKPYCQEFSDLMDGFVIHAPECRNYQHTSTSSHPGCINFTHVSRWPAGLSAVR